MQVTAFISALQRLLNFHPHRIKNAKEVCYNNHVCKEVSNMKNGLILEGGGMRGAYTCGVLDAFLDYDIETDGVIGVSAGICHGCSYVSKQRERAFRVMSDYLNDRRYMSMQSLLRTGDLFNAQFVYHTIPEKLNRYDFDTFNRSHTRLYAVCSNLDSGEAEYIRLIHMEQDVEYVRASASLPLLSRIVELDGKKLLDGGVSDSIPIRKFQSMGYEKNIVVLTQHEGYRKKKSASIPLIRARYHAYPHFVAKMEDRHLRYNETLDYLKEQEQQGKVLIIRPKQPVNISRLEKNVSKLQALYDEGYEDTAKMISEIRAFLAQ